MASSTPRCAVGLLHLDYTNLWFGPRLGTRLVTYTPADAETQVRLEKLAADRAAMTTKILHDHGKTPAPPPRRRDRGRAQ